MFFKKNNTKLYIKLIITLILCVLLVSCIQDLQGRDNGVDGNNGEVNPPQSEGTDQSSMFIGNKDDTYYMCTFVKNDSHWNGVYHGFKTAADQLGVRTVYDGCDDYSAYAQRVVFEKIVAKRPEGIALAPITADEFKEPINNAVDSGVKVVCFSSDSPDSKRLALITSDNVREAERAAEFIARRLSGAGKVGIIERPHQSNHATRVKVFMEIIEQVYPRIDIVARVNAEGDEARAARLTTQMIQDHPDLDFIYCVAGIEGIGAGAAVKESGKDIKVFCYDADPTVIDMVKEGVIYGVIQPNTINQGYWSLLSLFIAQNNLINPISDWKQAKKSPLPVLIDNGVDIVTKENADYFTMP